MMVRIIQPLFCLLFFGVCAAAIDFEAQRQVPLAGAGAGDRIAVGKLDGDPHPDLLVSPARSDQAVFQDGLNVVIADGQGGFLEGTAFQAGVQITGLATADLNGDSILDVVTAEGVRTKGAAYAPCGTLKGGVPVFLGRGDGSFTFKACLVAADVPAAVVAGDFNEDGKADLIVSNASYATGGAPVTDVYFFAGKGDGTFQTGIVILNVYGDDAAIADFNADGHLDLAIGPSVFHGRGDGTFAAAGAAFPGKVNRLAVGDLNGDGRPDLASVASVRQNTTDDVVSYALNDGEGNLGYAGTVPVGSHPVGVAIADLNRDGRGDIITANFLGNNVTVLLSQGAGFEAPKSFPAGSEPTGIAAGDLNADGWPDLAVADNNAGQDGTLAILIQRASGPPPPQPDLSLTNSHTGAFTAGADGTFTLTVTNVGPGATTGVIEVTDALPVGLNYIAATGTAWNCSASGQVVRCLRDSPLAPQSASQLLVKVYVTAVAIPSIANTATVACIGDANVANNSSTDLAGVSVPAIWFPFYEADSFSFTGFGVSNDSVIPARSTFLGLGPDGNPLPYQTNPAVIDIGPRGQMAKQGSEIFTTSPASVQKGWVEVTSDRFLGSLFMFGSGQQLDGSIGFTQQSKLLYFAEIHEGPATFRGQPSETLVSLANPNSHPITVKLNLFGETSQAKLANEVTLALPARGYFCKPLSQVFGQALVVENGYLTAQVTTGDGVIGFELVRLKNHDTALGLNGLPVNESSSPLYSAQFASVPGFATTLKVLNAGQSSRNLVITALDDQGTPSGAATSLTLAPGAARQLEAADILHLSPGASWVGTLRVEPDGPGIVGDVIFVDSGAFSRASSLPLDNRLFSQAVFSQVANAVDFYTGLALHNPGPQASQIMIEVYSNQGARTGQTVIDLQPHARISQLLTELMPSTAGQLGGYVVVRSTAPIVGQQLFGSRQVLSAVPGTVIQ